MNKFNLYCKVSSEWLAGRATLAGALKRAQVLADKSGFPVRVAGDGKQVIIHPVARGEK